MLQRTQKYWENRPEVYEMPFSEFLREYAELLPIMRDKEGRIGNLDLRDTGYVPMTEEEIALHKKDWKAFSRGRGFSEYDIAEYGRWHKITGQTDNLEYAINDTWRRLLPDWEMMIYLKHIERAKAQGIKLEPRIEQSYVSILKKYNLQTAKKNIKTKSNKVSIIQTMAHNENDDW